MKNVVALIFAFSLFGTGLLAKPYAIINNVFTEGGCLHFRVTIWDDNGTPEDPSDDFKLVRDTMNECDNPPKSAPYSGNDNVSNPSATVIGPTELEHEDEDGVIWHITQYKVQVFDDELELIGAKNFMNVEHS